MSTLDLTAAAAFLHVHEHTLEAWARTGKVPAANVVQLDQELTKQLSASRRRKTG